MSENNSIMTNVMKLIDGLRTQLTDKSNDNTLKLKTELIQRIQQLAEKDTELYQVLKTNEGNVEKQFNEIKNKLTLLDTLGENKEQIIENIQKIVKIGNNYDSLKKQTVERVKQLSDKNSEIYKIIEQNKNDLTIQLEQIKKNFNDIDTIHNEEIEQLKKLVEVLTKKVDLYIPIAIVSVLIITILLALFI